MNATLQAIREIIATDAGVEPSSIGELTPLVESGLLTSLQAVTLLDRIEELTGRPVCASRLGPHCFRDLRSLQEHLLGEPQPEALRGAALQSWRRLDDLVVAAAERDGASEERHAPLLPLDVVRRAGWLRSFPHLLTLAAPVEPARRETVSLAQDADASDLAAPGALPAATCHAVLAARAGRAAVRESVTACGPCWRAEAEEVPGVRLRCFTMREVVAFGTPAEASAFVRSWHERLPRLAAALGLPASLQPASDPFFDPQADPKARAQELLGPVKHELVAGGVALASVNLHRAFFADAFGFGGEAPTWTACVAFGLERWTHALRGGVPQGTWDDASEALR